MCSLDARRGMDSQNNTKDQSYPNFSQPVLDIVNKTREKCVLQKFYQSYPNFSQPVLDIVNKTREKCVLQMLLTLYFYHNIVTIIDLVEKEGDAPFFNFYVKQLRYFFSNYFFNMTCMGMRIEAKRHYALCFKVFVRKRNLLDPKWILRYFEQILRLTRDTMKECGLD